MDLQQIVVYLLMIGFPVIHSDPTDFLSLIPMLDSEKQQWIDSHNYCRRQVTNPEAANMKLMTWDDELAASAEDVVKTCAQIHTAQRDRKTSVFSVIGENLFTGGKFRFSEMMVNDGIAKLWYDEVQHYDFSTTSCASGEQCGHYTQIVWANTYKVGCAIAECKAVENGYAPFLVCCNYGPAGNLVLARGPADPPYIHGEVCSKCGNDDACNDQLCSNAKRDIAFTTTTVEPTTPTTAETTTTASPTAARTTTTTKETTTTASPTAARTTTEMTTTASPTAVIITTTTTETTTTTLSQKISCGDNCATENPDSLTTASGHCIQVSSRFTMLVILLWIVYAI